LGRQQFIGWNYQNRLANGDEQTAIFGTVRDDIEMEERIRRVGENSLYQKHRSRSERN